MWTSKDNYDDLKKYKDNYLKWFDGKRFILTEDEYQEYQDLRKQYATSEVEVITKKEYQEYLEYRAQCEEQAKEWDEMVTSGFARTEPTITCSYTVASTSSPNSGYTFFNGNSHCCIAGCPLCNQKTKEVRCNHKHKVTMDCGDYCYDCHKSCDQETQEDKCEHRNWNESSYRGRYIRQCLLCGDVLETDRETQEDILQDELGEIRTDIEDLDIALGKEIRIARNLEEDYLLLKKNLIKRVTELEANMRCLVDDISPKVNEILDNLTETRNDRRADTKTKTDVSPTTRVSKSKTKSRPEDKTTKGLEYDKWKAIDC